MSHFYVAQVVFKCSKCNKWATHDVRGSRNQSYGKFCEKHAEQHAKYLRSAAEQN